MGFNRLRSYDRLFPNQDTLPRGGFGNLIALPLQYEARQAGNTVFVDDGFVPYPDQWGRLATVERLSAQRVEEIVRDATAGGRVVGLRIADADDVEEPWLRPSQRSHSLVRDVGPLPDEVEVVVAQRVFVAKKGLPPALINQIKRLAAFQNPEFFKKQAMRLSTALTPRVINCAEDLPAARSAASRLPGCAGRPAVRVRREARSRKTYAPTAILSKSSLGAN